MKRPCILNSVQGWLDFFFVQLARIIHWNRSDLTIWIRCPQIKYSSHCGEEGKSMLGEGTINSYSKQNLRFIEKRSIKIWNETFLFVIQEMALKMGLLNYLFLWFFSGWMFIHFFNPYNSLALSSCLVCILIVFFWLYYISSGLFL